VLLWLECFVVTISTNTVQAHITNAQMQSSIQQFTMSKNAVQQPHSLYILLNEITELFKKYSRTIPIMANSGWCQKTSIMATVGQKVANISQLGNLKLFHATVSYPNFKNY